MQWLSEHVRVKPGARIRFLEGVAFLSKVEDGYRYDAELFVVLLCPRQIEVWLSCDRWGQISHRVQLRAAVSVAGR